MSFTQTLRRAHAGVLEVAYVEAGPADGPAVFLLHGFPYDIHAYEEVTPILARAGCRVIVPFLRGYGATIFLDPATPRSGEQAALGADLLALMDALRVESAVLGGYDWGGRAACVVAALWPERCNGLVSANSYNVQDISRAMTPEAPETEHRMWYQYYFHSERGRAGLFLDRQGICRLLWRLWSPTWSFEESQFLRSAAAFDNPDFVEVVIHSYRHRFGLVNGDPAYAAIECALAVQPAIAVPSITIDGAADGVRLPAKAETHASKFTGPRTHRLAPGVGHNVPQEAPRLFADACIELVRLAS